MNKRDGLCESNHKLSDIETVTSFKYRCQHFILRLLFRLISRNLNLIERCMSQWQTARIILTHLTNLEFDGLESIEWRGHRSNKTLK